MPKKPWKFGLLTRTVTRESNRRMECLKPYSVLERGVGPSSASERGKFRVKRLSFYSFRRKYRQDSVARIRELLLTHLRTCRRIPYSFSLITGDCVPFHALQGYKYLHGAKTIIKTKALN